MEITDMINHGDLSHKPGWIRWSLHPTMTGSEVILVITPLKYIVYSAGKYKKDYIYNNRKNIFYHKNDPGNQELLNQWFSLGEAEECESDSLLSRLF